MADRPSLFRRIGKTDPAGRKTRFCARSGTAAVCPFRPDKTLAENIAVRLKFPKNQKENLIRLAEAEGGDGDFSSAAKLKQAVYRLGKDVCLSLLLLRDAANRGGKIDPDEAVRAVRNATVPVFPVSGKDIIRHGITGNAKIGAAREYLEQVWVDSGFELTRDELLAKIKP